MSTYTNELFDISEVYKPFRNKLRKLNFWEGLYLIWGYSSNYFFNRSFPKDIETLNHFNPNNPDLHMRKMNGGLFDHELEFFLKEIIINCDLVRTEKSILKKKNFAPIVNYFRKDLNDEVGDKSNLKETITFEFNRIAHLQFHWQSSFNRDMIFRYYYLFNETGVSSIIEKKLGLSSQEVFLVGFLFFGWTGQSFRNQLPVKTELKKLPESKFNLFIQHFSVTVEEARTNLKANQQINQNIFYSYNSLLDKPIITDNNQYFCPIPLFIFWRITSGLYYSIVNEPEFANAFGSSFEKHTGNILRKCCKKMKYLEQTKYNKGKDVKDTSDWLTLDSTSIMFIECKVKRLTINSKTTLQFNLSLEKDLTALSKAVGQLYKTYIDYSNNLYLNLQFEQNKIFVPLVLTLENWYIDLMPKELVDKVEEKVVEILKENQIDPSLIKKYPYKVICIEEFEIHLQMMDELGIARYFEMRSDSSIIDYQKKFSFTELYESDYEKVFLDPFKDETQKN